MTDRALRKDQRLALVDLRELAAPALPTALEQTLASLDPLALLEVVVATPQALGKKPSSLHRSPPFPCGDAFVVTLSSRPVPPLHDLTDLPAPEPMAEVLRAAASLGQGELYYARLPHYPTPLVPRLLERKVPHQLVVRPDGSATLLLWGAA